MTVNRASHIVTSTIIYTNASIRCMALGLASARTRFLNAQRGVALVEALISIAILAILGVTYLSVVSTSAISTRNLEKHDTADILARSQLEHTKSETFQIAPASYAIMTPVKTGYVVTSLATAIAGRDDNIQLVTVSVTQSGQTVSSLQTYKINR